MDGPESPASISIKGDSVYAGHHQHRYDYMSDGRKKRLMCWFLMALKSFLITLPRRLITWVRLVLAPLVNWVKTDRPLESKLFSAIKIVLACFIMLCIVSLVVWLRSENDIVILHFQTPSNQGYNGEALSDLLTCDLIKINQIYQNNRENNIEWGYAEGSHSSQIEAGYGLPIETLQIETGYIPGPGVTLRDFTLDYSLSQSGMISQGPISLSLGEILTSLKRLLSNLNIINPPNILSASLQNYGTKTIIVVCLANSSTSPLAWEVSSKDNCSQEEIPELVEELAYQVAYSISRHGLESPHTWQTFANITQGLEAYQAFQTTGDLLQLDYARQMALNAQKHEPRCNGSANLLMTVAIGYESVGNISQAMFIYNAITEVNPHYTMAPYAWYNKGIDLNSLGRYNDSIQAYRKAIELNQSLIGAWNNIGSILDSLGKHDEAIQAYDMVIQVDPGFALAWYNKGIALDSLDKHDEAIQAYDNATQVDPRFVAAWDNKGDALDSLGKHDEAIQAYDMAIQVDPGFALAWYNKGIALLKLRKYDEAIQAYDNATRINPGFADAWYNKGIVLLKLRKYDEALQAYDMAIQVDPEYADAWYNKGADLYELSKYDEAFQAYDNATRINPGFADAWNGKGIVLLKLSKYDEALQAYRKAIELNQSLIGAWNDIGGILDSLGKHDEAIQAYDMAIQVDPGFALAWYNKGVDLYMKGKNDDANAAFARAKELGYTG